MQRMNLITRGLWLGDSPDHLNQAQSVVFLSLDRSGGFSYSRHSMTTASCWQHIEAVCFVLEVPHSSALLGYLIGVTGSGPLVTIAVGIGWGQVGGGA
jgi:hypothetical protein